MCTCIMNVRCEPPCVAIAHAIAAWIIPAGLAGAAVVRRRAFYFFLCCRFETPFVFRPL